MQKQIRIFRETGHGERVSGAIKSTVATVDVETVPDVDFGPHVRVAVCINSSGMSHGVTLRLNTGELRQLADVLNAAVKEICPTPPAP